MCGGRAAFAGCCRPGTCGGPPIEGIDGIAGAGGIDGGNMDGEPGDMDGGAIGAPCISAGIDGGAPGMFCMPDVIDADWCILMGGAAGMAGGGAMEGGTIDGGSSTGAEPGIPG